MPRSPHRACRRQLPPHTPTHPHPHTPTPPHPHTHTHTCSEQALRILMWNVSHVQKNTPIKPDRNWLMTRGEKQCQGILSTSLLDATHPSEPRRSLSLERLRQLCRKQSSIDVPVLGLAGAISEKSYQNDLASYVHDIHAKICRYR